MLCRRLNAIGMVLILISITLADSEWLVVPFVVMMTGAVLVIIGRRLKDVEHKNTER